MNIHDPLISSPLPQAIPAAPAPLGRPAEPAARSFAARLAPGGAAGPDAPTDPAAPRGPLRARPPVEPASPPKAPDAVTPSKPSAVTRELGEVLSRLRTEERKLDRFLRRARRGADFELAELVEMQSLVYRYSRQVEMVSKLVERFTGALKQTLRTQI